MTVKINSVAFRGVQAVPVDVEVQKTRGLFGRIAMVGLPSSSVRESRERVRAAIQASRFPFPRGALIINFAPADLKKEGTFYDLPVALGILGAAGIIQPDSLRGFIIAAELALDGRLRPVPGMLSAAILARERGKRGLVIAPANEEEARLVPNIEIRAVHDLKQAALEFGADPDLCGPGSSPLLEKEIEPANRRYDPEPEGADQGLDYSDVLGQETAKEAIVTAAAGGHNIIMIGPPGTGKTMLATRFPTILPDLDMESALEVSRVHSFRGRGLDRLIKRPPFRAPHHTISYAGLVGGGGVPRPGEISLAHGGVLFLDELPEFGTRTLETLRQPLEQGVITISRAAATVTLPARLTLVSSMNPCPCGFLGDSRRRCICTPRQIHLYVNRISGPILDRLDMQIEVPAVPHEILRAGKTGLSSGEMVSRIVNARKRQQARFGGGSSSLNAHMGPDRIRKLCRLTSAAHLFLDDYMIRHPLSGRGHSSILKVARTVADLEGEETICKSHMERTVHFRWLDRALSDEDDLEEPERQHARQGSSRMM